jgi:hypothetical protein
MESLLSWPTEDPTEYTRTDIVRWWEGRRLHFNVYVGVVGVITWFPVNVTACSRGSRNQADFFVGGQNSITLPRCCGGSHFTRCGNLVGT